MGKALYRKYRSKSLSEIVGQEHITQTLAKALKSGKISHAYLLTGPRGVGKTSIARILAHEINELAYDEDNLPIDIIEIDAASNRRIDEIRDLRDKVHIAPVSAKYKVYIIDEVHMLTKEAFNALLKTLEEPPAHVVFILATTEAHKLPETIISRTQRFTFKPIEKPAVTKHLKQIAKKENIAVSDEALALIADHGGGSFRDSISLLDQAAASGDEVTLEAVQTMLGIAPPEAVEELLSLTLSGDTSALLDYYKELLSRGFQPTSLAKQLHTIMRQRLLVGQTDPLTKVQTLNLMKQLLNVMTLVHGEQQLELLLLEMSLGSEPPESAVQTAPSPPKTVAVQPAKPVKKAVKSSSVSTPADFETGWKAILDSLKKKHNTLYGIIRMAVPEVAGNHITLYCRFPFHQKRLAEAKNQQIIGDLLQQTFAQPMTVECIVDAERAAGKVPTTEAAPPNNDMNTITNIFGGGEMLE